MILYLLRHGIAVPRDEEGGGDDMRALTEEGRRRMHAVARGMLALDLGIERILSSPYLRAKQTAAIVGEAIDRPVEYWNVLTPDAAPRQTITKLRTVPEERILLAGHEPHLSQLISLLVCGHPDAGVVMKKGGLCKLSSDRLTDKACATLEWLLAPAHLSRLRF